MRCQNWMEWVMAVDADALEAALETALISLASVATSKTAVDSDKIAASKVLIEAVVAASGELRKTQMASAMLPLMTSLTRNLSGTLEEGDDYAPVFGMDICQQSSLLMAVTKELN